MTTNRNLTFDRDVLRDLQDLVWTAGYVVDAIRGTQGVDVIEQTLLRPTDGDVQSQVSCYGILVKPKSDMNVYRLGRILADRIEKAKAAHFEAYTKFWPAYCYTGDLNIDKNREYDIGAIGTDLYGRPEIIIKITLYHE